jgi:hypothetical protein
MGCVGDWVGEAGGLVVEGPVDLQSTHTALLCFTLLSPSQR